MPRQLIQGGIARHDEVLNVPEEDSRSTQVRHSGPGRIRVTCDLTSLGKPSVKLGLEPGRWSLKERPGSAKGRREAPRCSYGCRPP